MQTNTHTNTLKRNCDLFFFEILLQNKQKYTDIENLYFNKKKPSQKLHKMLRLGFFLKTRLVLRRTYYCVRGSGGQIFFHFFFHIRGFNFYCFFNHTFEKKGLFFFFDNYVVYTLHRFCSNNFVHTGSEFR